MLQQDWKTHTAKKKKPITFLLLDRARELKQAKRVYNITDLVLWKSLPLSATIEPALRGSSFKSDII